MTKVKALVHDRGSQFTPAFDEVFRTEGIKILTTPVHTPVANSIAGRWTGTLRRELLDRTIIWNRQQLHRPVVAYTDHDTDLTGRFNNALRSRCRPPGRRVLCPRRT